MPKFVIFLTIIASASVVFGLPPRQFDGINGVRRAITNSIAELEFKRQEAVIRSKELQDKFTSKYFKYANQTLPDMKKAIQKAVEKNDKVIKEVNTTVDLSQCTKIITEIDAELVFYGDIEPECYGMHILFALSNIERLPKDISDVRYKLENLADSADQCLNSTNCEYTPEMFSTIMIDITKVIKRYLDVLAEELATTEEELSFCGSINGYTDFRTKLNNAKKSSKNCIKRMVAQNRA